jgi:acyl-CoA thioesterase FadM
MIGHLSRFAVAQLRALGRPPLGFLDESIVTRRVWSGDLDYNAHMNNTRYLAIMDLGRIDLVVRIGLALVAWRHRWRLMVAAATITFRRSMRLFEAYRGHTRVVGWDQRSFFLEQRFERQGQVVAVGLIKGVIWGRGKVVRTCEVLDALGIDVASPEIPSAVVAWRGSVDALRDGVRGRGHGMPGPSTSMATAKDRTGSRQAIRTALCRCERASQPTRR